jgi:hypothetical protein
MRLLAEWRTWIGHRQATDSHTAAEAIAFYEHLRENYPNLLSFQSEDDKQGTVNRWLTDAGLLKG